MQDILSKIKDYADRYNQTKNNTFIEKIIEELNTTPIEDEMFLEILPLKKQVTIMCDGEIEKLENVNKIECSVKDKKLKFLRMKEYEFINIVNEKFLTEKN